MEARKNHWEKVYHTKSSHEVSWYQSHPIISLQWIQESGLSKEAAIIDIGGGDSLLVDHLLQLGYENITVLDISETAIQKSKARLGDREKKINWIVSDVLELEPDKKYDLWHDRAAFHFLTEPTDIKKYVQLAHQSIAENGCMIIATFSDEGPMKCSGLDIQRYSEKSMENVWDSHFKLTDTLQKDHITPSGGKQNFLFSRFAKR